MKKTITIFLLLLCTQLNGKEIIDIYLNKKYSISTYVLEANFKKDYAPSKIKIDQDKNSDKNEAWAKIEEQLKNIAVKIVEDELAFFLIDAEIKKQLKQECEMLQIRRIYNGDDNYRNYRDVPTFTNIEIKLLSVVNNFGVYAIQYDFNRKKRYDNDAEFVVSRLYLADYKNNKVCEIGTIPDLNQQKVLDYFQKNNVRIEYNIKTEKQIRTMLNIKDNQLLEVLNSEINPLQTILDEAVRNVNDIDFNNTSDITGLKENEKLAIIEKCGYDMLAVEQFIKTVIPSTTSLARTLEPYYKVFDKLKRNDIPKIDLHKLV